MRLSLTAVLVIAGALLAIGLLRAHAHNAPSGWAYPMECCHDTMRECRQITEHDLIIDGDKITIKATGEIFTAPDRPWVQGSRGFAKWSGDATHPDGDFHRCSSGGRDDGITWCLYLPRPSI